MTSRSGDHECPPKSLSIVLRPAAAATVSSSHAAAIASQPFDIGVDMVQVFNDRLGAGRFFTGAGTDRLRALTQG